MAGIRAQDEGGYERKEDLRASKSFDLREQDSGGLNKSASYQLSISPGFAANSLYRSFPSDLRVDSPM